MDVNNWLQEIDATFKTASGYFRIDRISKDGPCLDLDVQVVFSDEVDERGKKWYPDRRFRICCREYFDAVWQMEIADACSFDPDDPDLDWYLSRSVAIYFRNDGQQPAVMIDAVVRSADQLGMSFDRVMAATNPAVVSGKADDVGLLGEYPERLARLVADRLEASGFRSSSQPNSRLPGQHTVSDEGVHSWVDFPPDTRVLRIGGSMFVASAFDVVPIDD